MEKQHYKKPFRLFRLNHELSLTEVAEAVGISAGFLSMVEHGKRLMPDNLYKNLILFYREKGIDTARLEDANLLKQLHEVLPEVDDVHNDIIMLLTTSNFSNDKLNMIKEFICHLKYDNKF